MRINLRKQLKGNPSDASLINKMAIVELGLHKDYEAFRFLKKAAKVKPGVQSLNNLAWFYLYNPEAGYDANKAISLLQDALELNPKSEFPYCLLGEAYLKANKPIEAKEILEKAIVLKSDFVALNNLGVAFYKLGLIEEASERFFLAHKAQKDKIESLLPYFNYGICQAELFNKANANKVAEYLLQYEEAPKSDLYGPEIAQIYYVTENYQEVNNLYSSPHYALSIGDYSFYLYSLIQVNKGIEAEALVNAYVHELDKLIVEAQNSNDDDWGGVSNRIYCIQAHLLEQKQIKELYNRIKKGYHPPLNYKPYIEEHCYLYGCIEHKHPEYIG